jgi:hypothetical protein
MSWLMPSILVAATFRVLGEKRVRGGLAAAAWRRSQNLTLEWLSEPATTWRLVLPFL